jgi:hypothetical protein
MAVVVPMVGVREGEGAGKRECSSQGESQKLHDVFLLDKPKEKPKDKLKKKSPKPIYVPPRRTSG